LYKRSSDAFYPSNQKFVPYTSSQGQRAAGGGGGGGGGNGTIRIHPKAYKSKYQYQFARSLIGKIIANNQQQTTALLKKNEKFLNAAMAANSLGAGINASATVPNHPGSVDNVSSVYMTSSVAGSGRFSASGNKENMNHHNTTVEDFSYYNITNLDQSKFYSQKYANLKGVVKFHIIKKHTLKPGQKI
jgi:hypothetical protein